MKRLALHVAVLSVILASIPAGGFALVGERFPQGRPLGSPDPAVAVDAGHPLVVLVRGWLWDPASRAASEPLEKFPAMVEDILRGEYGIEGEFVEFSWTRIPGDLYRAGAQFAAWARKVADRAAEEGRCVAFVGHSAGAAIVYNGAAQGVRMGYLGTLGLPTAGREKPPSVVLWANFYTTTHGKDIAGSLWGRRMPADSTVDLQMPHSKFWQSDLAARTTAEGVARTWDRCRGSPAPDGGAPSGAVTAGPGR